MSQEQESVSLIKISSFEQQLSPRAVAGNVAGLVENLLGEEIYEGKNPYKLQVIDDVEKTAYEIEIRKGADSRRNNTPWITIQQRVIDNHILVRTFLLEKIGDEWEYIDPYLEMYGESSLPELQTVLSRLDRAWQALKPKELPSNS